MEYNSHVLKVKISFIFSIGQWILSDNLETLRDTLTVSYEVVNRWSMLLLKPSALVISIFFFFF